MALAAARSRTLVWETGIFHFPFPHPWSCSPFPTPRLERGDRGCWSLCPLLVCQAVEWGPSLAPLVGVGPSSITPCPPGTSLLHRYLQSAGVPGYPRSRSRAVSLCLGVGEDWIPLSVTRMEQSPASAGDAPGASPGEGRQPCPCTQSLP